eukprot:2890201-Amphidinium_carterae.1
MQFMISFAQRTKAQYRQEMLRTSEFGIKNTVDAHKMDPQQLLNYGQSGASSSEQSVATDFCLLVPAQSSTAFYIAS